MNEEEKKAIKELTEIKELVEEDLKYNDYEVIATLDQIDLKSLVIVLNLIEKQEKIIQAMAGDIWIEIVKPDGQHFATEEEVIRFYEEKVGE